MKNLDKKVAVSPSTATICSTAAVGENAERKCAKCGHADVDSYFCGVEKTDLFGQSFVPPNFCSCIHWKNRLSNDQVDAGGSRNNRNKNRCCASRPTICYVCFGKGETKK